MKKKILIIVPILIVALIVIIAIPKHNNNDIEETPQEVVETPEVSEPEPEITPEPEKEKTLRQEKGIAQFNAKQAKIESHEVKEEIAEPEAVETVEDLEDGINSTHTDIELGDDEYKGDTGTDALQSEYDSLSEEEQEMVDQIVEDMMKEHPEWFTDTAPSTSEGNYEDIGTPSTGELPGEFDMSGDSGVPAGTVY